MAFSETLGNLRNDARLFGDERPGGVDAYASDDELTRLVNHSIRRVRFDIMEAGGHELFATTETISIVSGTSSYSVAAGHEQTLLLQLQWGANNVEDLEPWEWPEQAKLKNMATWGQGTAKAYRLIGDTIEIYPTPTTAVNCLHVYVPQFTPLSDPYATFDGVIPGWSEWVALDVAGTLKDMQDLDSRPLRARAAELHEQLMERAMERAGRDNIHMVDMDARQRPWWPVGGYT